MVSPRVTYSSFAISAPPTVRMRPRAVSVTITGRPANNDLPGFHVHSDNLALYLGNDPLRARGPDNVIPHLLSCNSVIATLVMARQSHYGQ